jgi:hypothetical protein
MKLFDVSISPSNNHPSYRPPRYTHFVILSNILLGSKMNVGNTTLLKSAPGRNCEMMCERTIPNHQHCPFPPPTNVYLTISLIRLYDRGLIFRAIRPCFVNRRSVAYILTQLLARPVAYIPILSPYPPKSSCHRNKQRKNPTYLQRKPGDENAPS